MKEMKIEKEMKIPYVSLNRKQFSQRHFMRFTIFYAGATAVSLSVLFYVMLH